MADAIRAVHGVRLLDHSSDASHNRSVFTLAGDAAGVERAVLALFERAVADIDLRTHRGEHPRMGAVDVVPVRADRRRHDGRVRRARAEGRRGGRGALQRAGLSLRRGGEPTRRARTSRTSAAASSKGWRPRWRPTGGRPTSVRRPSSDRRRHGRRRADAPHRLQHQPGHGSAGRREEDRRRRPPQQRRLPVREGDGDRARRRAASSRSR